MRLQILTAHVPRDLKRWLEKAAAEIDISLAAYVRRVLKLHREQEEQTRHAEEEAHRKPSEADPPLTDAGPEPERPGP